MLFRGAFLSSVVLCAAMAAQVKVAGPFIIFIGAPSSGKSTQAAITAKAFKLPVISAEDMIKHNQVAFQRAQEIGITGIPPREDPVMNQIFSALLKRDDYAKGLVLDGYPATNGHAQFLADLVQKGQLPKPVVLQLDVSDDTARKRAEQEPGFNADNFAQLLKDYHREFDMVRAYFPDATIIAIQGDKKPAAVSKEIKTALSGSLQKQ
jgi:adenylate kinase family enzyme